MTLNVLAIVLLLQNTHAPHIDAKGDIPMENRYPEGVRHVTPHAGHETTFTDEDRKKTRRIYYTYFGKYVFITWTCPRLMLWGRKNTIPTI